jgi:hypothetical protein
LFLCCQILFSQSKAHKNNIKVRPVFLKFALYFLSPVSVNLPTFMKNAVFWDVAPRSSCVNRRFRGTYCVHLQGRTICEQGTSMSCAAATQFPQFVLLHSVTCSTQADNSQKLRLPVSLVCPRPKSTEKSSDLIGN